MFGSNVMSEKEAQTIFSSFHGMKSGYFFQYMAIPFIIINIIRLWGLARQIACRLTKIIQIQKIFYACSHSVPLYCQIECQYGIS